jgi:cytochrome b
VTVPGDGTPAARSRVPAWDVIVRLTHWTLAGLVAVDLVRDDGDLIHRWIGYAAVAVVFGRLAWASVARSNARLADLRPSLTESRAYLRLVLRGHATRPAGHNPLGLWMVWLLWILVLLLGLTGWMSRLDAFWGDERVHDVHAFLADLLLAAVGLHLAGIATMSWLWRENLPAAMITGVKRTTPAAGRTMGAPNARDL